MLALGRGQEEEIINIGSSSVRNRADITWQLTDKTTIYQVRLVKKNSC